MNQHLHTNCLKEELAYLEDIKSKFDALGRRLEKPERENFQELIAQFKLLSARIALLEFRLKRKTSALFE